MVDLRIVCDQDFVSLNNTGSKLELCNLNAHTQEILVEFDVLDKQLLGEQCRDFIVFQTQIKKLHSTRILTNKISVVRRNEAAEDLNEQLVHVYHLKKLSNLILENKDMVKAKQHLLKYESFIRERSVFTSDLSETTIRFIKGLSSKQNFRHLNDSDSQLLYNNKNLTSVEFGKCLILKDALNTTTDTDTVATVPSSFEIVDNIQFSKCFGDKNEEKAQRTLNKQSLKMIMISLKMIKEATSICMKARSLLNMNHFKTPSGSSSKSKEFLKKIFDNIGRTEDLVNALSKNSSVLVRKDFNFLNKMFEELNVYLELDLFDAMQSK